MNALIYVVKMEAPALTRSMAISVNVLLVSLVTFVKLVSTAFNKWIILFLYVC